MMRLAPLWLGALLAGVVASPAVWSEEPIDNCSSLLGSLGVELRFAHRLQASARTSFVCPKDTQALNGASKQRVLNALGPPDATGYPEDGQGALAWYYYFGPAPRDGEERDPRQPELRFDFDPTLAVSAVRCRQHH